MAEDPNPNRVPWEFRFKAANQARPTYQDLHTGTVAEQRAKITQFIATFGGEAHAELVSRHVTEEQRQKAANRFKKK